MENAIKIAAAILNSLPQSTDSPETTEQKEGFIHPTSIEGLLEKVIIKFIIRSFSNEGLTELENKLKDIVENVMKQYPKSSYNFVVEQQYRNMKLVLDKFPQVTAFAMEAMKRCGLNPIQSSIRGGTDGSRLSFMGLPCPNIFAGEHAFHSKLEWVSVQDMNKAVETLVNLAMIWEENSN
jgi:tripeptide aminopeptidase